MALGVTVDDNNNNSSISNEECAMSMQMLSGRIEQDDEEAKNKERAHQIMTRVPTTAQYLNHGTDHDVMYPPNYAHHMANSVMARDSFYNSRHHQQQQQQQLPDHFASFPPLPQQELSSGISFYDYRQQQPYSVAAATVSRCASASYVRGREEVHLSSPLYSHQYERGTSMMSPTTVMAERDNDNNEMFGGQQQQHGEQVRYALEMAPLDEARHRSPNRLPMMRPAGIILPQPPSLPLTSFVSVKQQQQQQQQRSSDGLTLLASPKRASTPSRSGSPCVPMLISPLPDDNHDGHARYATAASNRDAASMDTMELIVDQGCAAPIVNNVHSNRISPITVKKEEGEGERNAVKKELDTNNSDGAEKQPSASLQRRQCEKDIIADSLPNQSPNSSHGQTFAVTVGSGGGGNGDNVARKKEKKEDCGKIKKEVGHENEIASTRTEESENEEERDDEEEEDDEDDKEPPFTLEHVENLNARKTTVMIRGIISDATEALVFHAQQIDGRRLMQLTYEDLCKMNGLTQKSIREIWEALTWIKKKAVRRSEM